MRSRHVERFNHDPDAVGYDADVRDETDPIREGYAELLRWTAGEARITETSRVLELGTGTGNLTRLLPRCKELVAVDASPRMLAQAESKLGARDEVRFVCADLLEYATRENAPFDAVVSTYAVHHLEPDERTMLYAELAAGVPSGAHVVFGDLMFENARERARILGELRASDHDELVAEIEDEFFWDVELDRAALARAGFRTETLRVSSLSWGIRAERS